MQFIYKEKLILTKEEVAILDNARILLDNIDKNAYVNGAVEKMACTAWENIRGLLSEEFFEMEE